MKHNRLVLARVVVSAMLDKDQSGPGTCGSPDVHASTSESSDGKQRVAKSAVWDYFSRKSSLAAECKACGQVLQTPSSTTTPLHNHLKQHPALFSELKSRGSERDRPACQPTLSDVVKRKQPLPPQKTAALTRKIAEMIALDMQPYSIVEDKGFKAVIQEAVPGYNLPSRTTFSRDVVPRLYDDTRRQVKRELEHAFDGGTNTIAFTADMWTSRSNHSFLSLTCHLVVPDFQLKTFLLSTRAVMESHTASNIASALDDVSNEWDIPSHVTVHIVTDNGRNIRAAVRQLPWFERSCFAHTLQLSISDAFAETPTATAVCKKARAIVGHYKHSPSASHKLETLMDQLKGHKLRLIQDVPTRWNSQYLMLERLLDMKEPVTVELATSGNTSIECPTAEEWRDISDLVKTLRPLYEATVDCSAEKYPTLSCQIPIIFGLLDCLHQLGNESKFAGALRRSLLSRFPSYKLDETASIAMFLDPRFKWVIYNNDDAMKMWLKDIVLREIYADPNAMLLAPEGRHAAPVGQPRAPQLTRVSLWNTFEDMASQVHSTLSAPEKEVIDYTSDTLLGRNNDPCQWWGTTGRYKYPKLAHLAKNYLAIPATSVPKGVFLGRECDDDCAAGIPPPRSRTASCFFAQQSLV